MTCSQSSSKSHGNIRTTSFPLLVESPPAKWTSDIVCETLLSPWSDWT